MQGTAVIQVLMRAVARERAALMAATFRLLSLKPMTLMWSASEWTHGYVKSAWNAPTRSHANVASQLMDLIPTMQVTKIPHLSTTAFWMNYLIKSDTKLSNQHAQLNTSGSPSVLVLSTTGDLINWFQCTQAMSLSVVAVSLLPTS